MAVRHLHSCSEPHVSDSLSVRQKVCSAAVETTSLFWSSQRHFWHLGCLDTSPHSLQAALFHRVCQAQFAAGIQYFYLRSLMDTLVAYLTHLLSNIVVIEFNTPSILLRRCRKGEFGNFFLRAIDDNSSIVPDKASHSLYLPKPYECCSCSCALCWLWLCKVQNREPASVPQSFQS